MLSTEPWNVRAHSILRRTRSATSPFVRQPKSEHPPQSPQYIVLLHLLLCLDYLSFSNRDGRCS